MGIACRRLSWRGLLVGIAGGAILGFLLGVAMAEWPMPAFMTIADQFRGIAGFAALVAILGGLAGAVLSRDGWQMFAGGVVGAIAMGLLGVLGTGHLLGLTISIIGGPLGALAVYLHFLTREPPAPIAKSKAMARSEGLWDREIDR
jgi:hypothetical protein